MEIKKSEIVLILFLVFLVVFTFLYIKNIYIQISDNQAVQNNQKSMSGSAVKDIKYESLSEKQKTNLINLISSSEMVKKIPADSPILIQFYNFDSGYRTWQNSVLLAQGKLLSEGEPVISLIIHSKYINELQNSNLCDIVKNAKLNGDLAVSTEYSKAKLLWKYKSLLEYRNCFGI